VKDLLPIKEILNELNKITEEATEVRIDNQSTIKLASNTNSRLRTEHIDIRNRWLGEQVAAKKIKLKHVPSKEQVADILTKAMPKHRFEYNRGLLMMFISLLTMIMVTMTNSYTFTPVKPVFYVPSDKQAFNGTKEFQATVLITNPCSTYFRDVTEEKALNDRLTRQCDREFALSTFKLMNNCKFKNKDQKNLNRARYSRGAPVVGWFLYSILAGTQTYSVVNTELNTLNINEIVNATQEGRKGVAKAIEGLKTTKSIIHGIYDKIEEIESKLSYWVAQKKQVRTFSVNI